MKECKKCGEKIAANAKTCPKCGYRFGLPGWAKVLIILGIIFFCLVGCVASCTNAVDKAIKEVDKEYEDVNGKSEFNINETFENKYFKVTVTDVDLNFQSSNQFIQPGSGRKFIKVFITAENVGDESSNISSVYFKCYADGQNVKEQIMAEDDNVDFGGSISPGKTTKGPIYFEVPLEAKKITLEYEPKVLDSKYSVVFNLN